MSDHLVKAYSSLPVNFTHGDGCYLWDSEGKQYLDALCGISVTSLGHNLPELTTAIQQQASTLLHTSNLYSITWQQKLADLLCDSAGMDRVFFANSGAEANEAAIKLARLYGHQRGIDNPQIVVMQHAFHGRTMATLSATGNRKVQAGFEPLVAGFVRAPYNDIEAVSSIAANNRQVVAVLVEPVQGEAGIVIPDADYLQKLREICDQNHWLLMLDEVQTGMGRSGKLFAHQHAGIQPDVMTLAKALGNGVPIGACICRGAAAEVFSPGKHGSTFGGNPLACRAAYTVLDYMIKNNIANNAADRGEQLSTALQQGLANNIQVASIRHMGLLLAVEMKQPCAQLVNLALEQGLLINVTADNVVRLLPPLIISEAQTADLAQRLIDCINQFSE
ncbi:MAG: aspartate aminotransferase family protein [Gammaproteobacteria bacterium]|nr:MAG: aspartate aminotransferase family protein [Gammaproteobacteria bacterium]